MQAHTTLTRNTDFPVDYRLPTTATTNGIQVR